MQLCSTAVAFEGLESLVRTVDPSLFRKSVCRLHTRFSLYADTCPVPVPAPGLVITPEIRNQCECYLPIAEISTAFYRLYRTALTYPPILSSTPFHMALSWADVFATLPPNMKFSADPARLLEALCADRTLLVEFLCASFLPLRFYKGFGRYPGQQEFVRSWLAERNMQTVRCLDAACGTGDGTYDLARMLSELGYSPEEVHIDGWTLEPLEVWAAVTRRFPHDRRRETELKTSTSALMADGFMRCIAFARHDILRPITGMDWSGDGEQHGFDIILCNGLLGGPILHKKEELELAIGNLAKLLAPGGILLAADSFHGGWKQQCPQSELWALFETNHLKTCEAGKGIGGLKSDQ